MWQSTLAQVPEFDPSQWGPFALPVGLVFSFLVALATRKLRWGSDYDDLFRLWEQEKAARLEAEQRERDLLEKKDDEIARIRDRIEEKLTRANDVLSATTEALKNRGQ